MASVTDTDDLQPCISIDGAIFPDHSLLRIAKNSFSVTETRSSEVVVIRTRSSDRPQIANANGLLLSNLFTIGSAFAVEENTFSIEQLGEGDVACFRSHNYVLLTDGSSFVFRANILAQIATGAAVVVRFFHVLGPRGFYLESSSFFVIDGNTVNATNIAENSDLHFVVLTASGWFETFDTESQLMIFRNKVIAPREKHRLVSRDLLNMERMFIHESSKLVVAQNEWKGEATAFIMHGWMLSVLCNIWDGHLLGPIAPLLSVTTSTLWHCPQACALTYPKVDCSLEPILLGQMTGYTIDYSETRVVKVLHSLFDGIGAAVHEENLRGGIHGRLIVIDSCDGTFFLGDATRCMNHWRGSSVTAILGILFDDGFRFVRDVAIEQKKVLVGMLTLETSSERLYSPSLVYTKPAMDNFFAAGLKKLVGESNLKRIGIVLVSGGLTVIGLERANFVEAIVASLADLGVEYTGTYTLDVDGSPVLFYQQPYLSWIARRPQGIVLLAHPISIVGFFMIDVLGRSARNAGVDPNVKIVTWDGLTVMTEFALDYMRNRYPGYSLENRVYVSFSYPVMSDDSFEATSHARREIGNLHRNPKHTEDIGASLASNAMILWVSAKATIAMYKALPPTNLTGDALRESVFNAGLYPVSDLLIGPFTGPCRGSAVADVEPLIACRCNQGFNTYELYRLQVNGSSVEYVREVSARVSVPVSVCGVSPSTVASPLVLLSSAPNEDGVARELRVQSVVWKGKKYTLTTQLLTNKRAALAMHLQQVMNDRILSLAFCIVEDLADNVSMPAQISPALAASTGLPFVDPYSTLAQLHPEEFTAHWIVLSATLQQEIPRPLQLRYGASATVLLTLLFRSVEAHAVARTIALFCPTRLVEPLGAVAVQSADAIGGLDLPTGDDRMLLIVGVRGVDTQQIIDYLTANTKSVVLLAFSELCAIYTALVAFNLSVDVSRRIVFATSLRNWNAPDLPSNKISAHMQSFFNTVERKESGWHPMELRGFIASTAVSQVASFMTNSFTPANVLNAWYLLSVVQLDADDVLGAYSKSKCYSDLDAGCETNTGARIVRTMSLAHILHPAQTAMNGKEYLSNISFGSGRVTYMPLPSGSSISTWIIVGVAFGAAAFVSAIIAWIYSRQTSRNNRHAPKDPDKAFTLIFTDIQSSTNLWAAAPEAMANVLELHHELIRSLINKHQCYEVKTIGDAFMIACRTAEQALRLSHELQFVFFNRNWGSPEVDEYYAKEKKGAGDGGDATEDEKCCWNGIRVRVGFHRGMGEIKLDEVTKGYDYYGTVANVAARVESAACGGQVLLTRSAYEELLNSQPSCLNEFRMTLLGKTALKGVPEPVEVFELATVLGRSFKPLPPLPNNMDTGENDRADVVEVLQPNSEDSISSGDEMSQSLTAAQGRYGVRSKTKWTLLSDAFVTVLFSVLPADQRAAVMKRLCDRWNVAGNDKMMLAKRLGVIVQRKYKSEVE